LATRTRPGVVAWDGFEPSHWPASEAGGLPIAPPGKAVGEEGFEPSTARFQTAYADLTALLAVEGGVGHWNGLHGDAQARRLVLGIETRSRVAEDVERSARALCG
jgi:hypothetical protein